MLCPFRLHGAGQVDQFGYVKQVPVFDECMGSECALYVDGSCAIAILAVRLKLLLAVMGKSSS